MLKKFAVLLLAAMILLSACGGSPTATVLPPTAAATSTPVVQTVVVEKTVIVEKVVTATPLPPTPTLAFTQTALPTATPTEELVTWTQIQVGKYSEMVDGKWELPLGTHYAVTTENGRYEAVDSAPVGVVNGKDHGWCSDDQLDCPPHALLVRVEVPVEHISCFSAEMDISWRVQLNNECGTLVPVRFAVRYNDVTRSSSELLGDYLSLAGLEQQVLNAASEVGLFVSVREDGTSELDYGATAIPFGYSCWDCLADTQGVSQPQPVQLSGDNISNFGPQTPAMGESSLPGLVFPLPRPGSTAFELSLELEVAPATPLTVWAGRYDAQPTVSATATPTVTITPTP